MFRESSVCLKSKSIFFNCLLAVDCGLLQRPNNGTKVGNKTTFLNEVSFFCNKGFYMLGSSKRTCQADKQWSGVKTFCRGKAKT